MAVQPDDVGTGRLETPAGLRGSPTLPSEYLAMNGHGHHRGDLGVFADGRERQQRLLAPRERLGHYVVDPGIGGPTHLLREDPLDLLDGPAVVRIVDVGVADVSRKQGVGLAR